MAKLFAKAKQQRSDKSRPLLAFMKKHATARKRKNWRAKQLSLGVSRRRQLIITIRRFRLSEQHRSSRYRQLVVCLPLSIYGVREVALRQRLRKRLPPVWSASNIRRMASVALVAGGLGGVTYFGLQLVTPEVRTQPPLSFNVPAPDVFADSEDNDDFLPSSTPLRLKADSIALDTEIMTVGQESDGTMEVPPLGEHIAGWYRLGPTPGERGPAVIVGHVDNREGPSVFWRLGELSPGDRVQIEREDGRVLLFRINEVARYSQDDFPTEKVYGDIGHAGLRLITCGGEFDTRSGRYTHNTVVYATLVSD